MLQNMMDTYQSSNGYGMSDSRATSALATGTAAASKESARSTNLMSRRTPHPHGMHPPLFH